MQRRTFIAGATAIGAASLAGSRVAFGQQATLPEYYPSDYQKLVDAAKAEGSVTLYTSASPWDAVVKRFNALYPEIEVKPLSLGSSELVERYLTEAGSNNTTCDVMATSATDSILRLIDRNELVDYGSPEVAKIPDWAHPKPGVFTFLAEPQVMIYNKALLSPDLIPKGFQDLAEKVKAHPDVFNGHMVTYGAQFGSIGYCSAYLTVKHHGDVAWDWLKVIGPQTKLERSAGPMAEKTTLGEYTFGYAAGYGAPVAAARDPDRAQVFGWKLVEDGQVFLPYSMVIGKGAKNQNAAKLFIDVALSHDGQLGWMQGSRVPVRSDITDAERGTFDTYTSLVNSIGEENAIRLEFDPALITDYDAFIAKWEAAYNVQS
jgi:iron(III) transport system substrate-binding protein